jgi:hypothetical protein
MFDDQTEIRHAKPDKQLWRAAAAASKKKLSAWIRDSLNERAERDLCSLARER